MKTGLTIYFIFFLATISCAQVIEGTLLGRWSDDSIEGSSRFNNSYNEIWGYHQDDKEYAIIGSTAGTHIIDVTDPANLFEVHFVKGSSHGTHIIHRDYHDFKGYLYTISDEDTGILPGKLQIFDLTKLPDELPVVYESRSVVQRAHNIFIDVEESTLYTLSAKGGTSGYNSMRIYSLVDPLNPTLLAAHDDFDGFSITHVHDAFVKNNIAYLNCGAQGFGIVDFSEPQNPQLLSTLTQTELPDIGYNHSGWPNEDQTYYYMGDETWGTDMKVVDIREQTNAQAITTFNAESTSSFTIPHNQIVACDYLYVSYYYDGLQVYDISTPAEPKRVMHYQTSTLAHRDNFEGAWGIYPFLPSGNILVSDMQNGLFVIESIDANCNQIVSTTNEEREPESIFAYPNPAIEKVNLKNVDLQKDNILEWIDTKGKLVHTQRLISKEIDIPKEITSGIYFLKVKNKQEESIQKMVIQKN